MSLGSIVIEYRFDVTRTYVRFRVCLDSKSQLQGQVLFPRAVDELHP